MSLRRFFQGNRKAKADRSSLTGRLKNDRTPAYTSNVTTALAHTLPVRDSVRLPDEPDSSLTDTLAGGVEDVSQLEVVTPNHSKRPSGNKFPPLLIFLFNFLSILPDLCCGWSTSLGVTCFSQWSFPRAHQIYICAAPSHRQSCKRQHYKSGENQRPWKHFSLSYAIQSITHGQRWEGHHF